MINWNIQKARLYVLFLSNSARPEFHLKINLKVTKRGKICRFAA
jgi:hypothetical protein